MSTPVDAAFEHHAPDDVAIVELSLVDGPAALLGVGDDGIPNGVDPFVQRRDVAVPGRLGVGHGGNDVVGKGVHEVDQKVTRPHGGVEDLEIEYRFGGIEPPQAADAAILGKLA